MTRKIQAISILLVILAVYLTGCAEAVQEEPTFTPSPTIELNATEAVLPETGPMGTATEGAATGTIPMDAQEGADETPTPPGPTPTTQTGEAEGTPEGTEPPPTNGEETPSVDEEALIDTGEMVYLDNCAQCHQEDGQGVEGSFPALAGNEFVTAEDPEQVVEVVLHGRGAMPSFADQLSDQEIAAVVSYIRNAWENDASVVSPEQVSQQR